MIAKGYQSSKILVQSILIKLAEKSKFNQQQFLDGNQSSAADKNKVK